MDALTQRLVKWDEGIQEGSRAVVRKSGSSK